MPDTPRRQLAAIMFADMVGYTALMQDDESRAHAQRDRIRSLLGAAVQEHHGEVLEYYGDGALSIFTSAVEAVECAVDLQRRVSTEQLIPLRIGVHTGDIVHDAEGIYGDGVNVASRIEGLSAPGGVMISGKVFDEIKNHPEIECVSIGGVRLKNVGYQLHVFAISNDGLSVPGIDEVRTRVEAGGDGVFVRPGEAAGEDGTPIPSPPVGTGEAFLQRLRERALLPWSLVYLAVAGVVLIMVWFVSAQLDLPSVVPQGVGVFAFVGLFMTLVLAWYHGAKGRQSVRTMEVVLLTALLGGGVAGVVLLPEAGAGPSARSALVASDPRPSVAALPWANRSGVPEDAYFADGIHDEILTRLYKIGGLRVISRQSVMQFRDSPLTSRRIAQELGVRYILEAGLLRVRDTVRINVQLIDAERDHVAWAVSQDRYLTLENLLAIQSEIAQVIADTLQTAITPKERAELARLETDDLEAYDFYLQGRSYFLRPGYLRENYEAAVALLERAIARDSTFALALATLSQAHGTMYWEGFDRSPERLERQRIAAEAAIRHQPDLPQAHQAIGWLHYVAGDFQRALEHYDAALAGLPNDGAILASTGYAHRRLGNWPQVFAAYEKAVRLNPRDATMIYDLGGHSYGVTRQFAAAMHAYNRALTLAPDFYDAALRKGFAWLHWRGNLDTLRAVIRGLPADLHSPEVDIARVEFGLLERDGGAVLRLLERDPAERFETQLIYIPRSLYTAWAHRLRGDSAAAHAAFDSARVVLEAEAAQRPDDQRVMASLGFAYAGVGRAGDAARMALQSSRANLRGGNVLTRPQSLETSARILAQAGLAREAVEQLDQLLSNPAPTTAHTLRLDPIYDPIRETQVFRELLEKYSVSGPDSGTPSLPS